MTAFFRLEEGRWFPALVTGPVSGILFGAAMGLTMSRINRRVLAGLEDLSPLERRTVARAAARGPATDDERLREAAAALVRRRQDEMARTRRWSLVLVSVLPVLYVVLAITQSRWWWWAAVAFLVLLAFLVTAPGRAERRLAVLSPPEVKPR